MNTIFGTMNSKQKIILGYFGFALVVALIVGISLIARGGVPKITSASTESQDNVYIARPTTTITLDQDIADPSDIATKIFPDTPHQVSIEGNTVTLTPLADLADGTPYAIWLIDTRVDDDEETIIRFANEPDDIAEIDIGAHKFITPENTIRRDFLAELPKDFGAYTISRVSERSLYVLIDQGSTQSVKNEVLALLAEKGITEEKYTVEFEDTEASTELQTLLDQQIYGDY